MLRNVLFGVGYVEEASNAQMCLTTDFEGTDKEFIETLKSVFISFYRESCLDTKQCCLQAAEMDYSFCPKCGADTSDISDINVINEGMREWFFGVVTGVFDGTNDLYEWLEDRGMSLSPDLGEQASGMGPCLLYSIGGFDHYLAGEINKCDISVVSVEFSDFKEIKP